jgi:hypothetical protein
MPNIPPIHGKLVDTYLSRGRIPLTLDPPDGDEDGDQDVSEVEDE